MFSTFHKGAWNKLIELFLGSKFTDFINNTGICALQKWYLYRSSAFAPLQAVQNGQALLNLYLALHNYVQSWLWGGSERNLASVAGISMCNQGKGNASKRLDQVISKTLLNSSDSSHLLEGRTPYSSVSDSVVTALNYLMRVWKM